MTIAETLTEFSKEFEEVKAEFTGRARKMFTASLKDLFENNPDLGMIEWEQYTPYFNDGDTCEFGVHQPFFIPVDVRDRTDDEDEYDYRYDCGMEENDDMKAVSRFIQNQDDLMQSLYGDHVKVVVRRDPKGIVVEVEEFDHG
jgi:hypothetical protein